MEMMLVAVRGASNQTTNSLSFAMEGVSEFLPAGLGIDWQDFASRMEGFAFNGIRGMGPLTQTKISFDEEYPGAAKNYKQHFNDIRTEICKIIQEKLGEPTRIAMSCR